MAKKRPSSGLGKMIGWLLGDKPSTSRRSSQKAAGQRNAAKSHRKPKRSNPDGELSRARALSAAFHGKATEVIKLSEKERRLPKYVVALGHSPAVTYEPRKGSKRHGYTWEHESGDYGFPRGKGKRKPVLAVDPKTKKPLLVNMSGMKLDPERGLVG